MNRPQDDVPRLSFFFLSPIAAKRFLQKRREPQEERATMQKEASKERKKKREKDMNHLSVRLEGSPRRPEAVVGGADPRRLYALVVWDRDAPYPQPGGRLAARSPFLHWLVVNAPGADFEGPDAQTLFPYLPPGPPPDSPPHVYVVDVLEQAVPIDASAASEMAQMPRQNFPLDVINALADPTAVAETFFHASARTMHSS